MLDFFKCMLAKKANLLAFLASTCFGLCAASESQTSSPEILTKQSSEVLLDLASLPGQITSLKNIDLCDRVAVRKHFSAEPITPPQSETSLLHQEGQEEWLSLKMIHVEQLGKYRCGVLFTRLVNERKVTERFNGTVEAIGTHFSLCEISPKKMPLHGPPSRTFLRWCRSAENMGFITIFTFRSNHLTEISIARDEN